MSFESVRQFFEFLHTQAYIQTKKNRLQVVCTDNNALKDRRNDYSVELNVRNHT